jgi:hypothetical protein
MRNRHPRAFRSREHPFRIRPETVHDQPKQAFTFRRNDCSRSTEMAVHVAPKYALELHRAIRAPLARDASHVHRSHCGPHHSIWWTPLCAISTPSDRRSSADAYTGPRAIEAKAPPKRGARDAMSDYGAKTFTFWLSYWPCNLTPRYSYRQRRYLPVWARQRRSQDWRRRSHEVS